MESFRPFWLHIGHLCLMELEIIGPRQYCTENKICILKKAIKELELKLKYNVSVTVTESHLAKKQKKIIL